MGVTSEVGLTNDRDLAKPWCLRNMTSFIPPRYWKALGTSHYITRGHVTRNNVYINQSDRGLTRHPE